MRIFTLAACCALVAARGVQDSAPATVGDVIDAEPDAAAHFGAAGLPATAPLNVAQLVELVPHAADHFARAGRAGSSPVLLRDLIAVGELAPPAPSRATATRVAKTAPKSSRKRAAK